MALSAFDADSQDVPLGTPGPGWSAHAIEQSGANRLIRPDMRYTGPTERELPVSS